MRARKDGRNILNVGCESGPRNGGIAYREMSQGVQGIEQGDWVQGDESGSTGNRTGELRTGR